MSKTPCCIVGAGPGGLATALKLSYLGISCVLIDKATFPRDKICGDALSGKVTMLLNRLDPSILQDFDQKSIHAGVWGIRFVAPNNKVVDVPFTSNKEEYTKNAAPGYVCKRKDFDHYLWKFACSRNNITCVEGVEIKQYEKLPQGGYRISNADGSLAWETPMLIVAEGAHSVFARKIGGIHKDNKHHAGGLRVYYKGVKDIHPDFIELHFIRDILPGYLWIFPLPNGEANVGLGLRTDIIRKKNRNLRKTLDEIIKTHPTISPRFAEATPLEDVKGFGLPFGSKTRTLSGDHYMLIGDAGSLVDPITGEGIGNAFYSGFIAAEQAQKCLAENNFSAAFLHDYDVRIARVLGKEMKLSYKLQWMLQFPWLANAMGNLMSGSQAIVHLFSEMYSNLDKRNELTNPIFWLKLWFKKG